MPTPEVYEEDGLFYYRIGKKRKGPFTLFEAAVATANEEDPEGPQPDIHPDLLES